MSWFQQFEGFRIIRDVLDVVFVAMIIYYLLKLIRGTRAVYMLIGLAVGVLVYWVSSFGELYTLNWLLYHFLGSLLLIVVVLFQNEIRRALTRIGRTPLFSFLDTVQDSIVIDELIRTCVSLANKKIGALLVIEKQAVIDDYVEAGTLIDAQVSKEILTSIFLPSSPIHDGAVLIQKSKISYASCFLPLSMNSSLDPELGTRHRAAIGLTEETDAIVLVISEEKGWISVAIEGKLIRGIDATALRKILAKQFETKVSTWFNKKENDKDSNKVEASIGEVEI